MRRTDCWGVGHAKGENEIGGGEEGGDGGRGGATNLLQHTQTTRFIIARNFTSYAHSHCQKPGEGGCFLISVAASLRDGKLTGRSMCASPSSGELQFKKTLSFLRRISLCWVVRSAAEGGGMRAPGSVAAAWGPRAPRDLGAWGPPPGIGSRLRRGCPGRPPM